MNKSSTDGTVLATGMRILFAAYIDFMFFGSLWGIMIYFITPYIATEIPPITKFISFLIIEAFVISKVRISPGFSYLSIRSLPWREVSIDGVVMQNIRFCDLHGSENSLFERDLEARGIPCLKIEREYGPLVETGRIKMRMEAFLERLG